MYTTTINQPHCFYSQPLAECRYSGRPQRGRPDAAATTDGCLAQGPRMKEPFSSCSPEKHVQVSGYDPAAAGLRGALGLQSFSGDPLTADSSTAVFGLC